ncbi:MAG: hypothetical protein IT330_14840 [Anaerolineae bacterium]|nr:hypothetical protein [Anaerolineae bacterium]
MAVGVLEERQTEQALRPLASWRDQGQVADLIADQREDVDRRVHEAVRDGAPDGGFTLSIIASPYEEELSPHTLANYVQFVGSGRKYAGVMTT